MRDPDAIVLHAFLVGMVGMVAAAFALDYLMGW